MGILAPTPSIHSKRWAGGLKRLESPASLQSKRCLMETLEPLSEGIHTELETHQRERSESATTAGGRPKQEHSYYAERDATKRRS
mmetsp:Transcript_29562/g.40094  ORF Transcript_29562/g.40094 Transcript_29562/m.40094 type:complete len:85 (+) Transcript_29562:665-919(+)